MEADDEEENNEDAAPVAEKFTRTEKINLIRDACSLLDISGKVTKLLIKSFATSSLIFATLPPPKPRPTVVQVVFSSIIRKQVLIFKVILPDLIIT